MRMMTTCRTTAWLLPLLFLLQVRTRRVDIKVEGGVGDAFEVGHPDAGVFVFF